MSILRSIEVLFLGNTKDLEAALGRAGVVADESGKQIGDRFNAGTSKAATGIQKLKAQGEGLGLPFTNSLDAVARKLDEAETHANKFGDTMAALGKTTLVAGAAGLLAVGGEAVKAGLSFAHATTTIQANAGITAQAAKNIGNAFLDTAGHSTYSAQEMADAYAQVAAQLGVTEGKALSTAQAANFMTTATHLAEAGQTDLGTATSALAQVMQAYSMHVSQAGQASNVLYNASKSVNVPLDSVAKVVTRLHGRIGNLAPSLGDIGTLMVELAGQGFTGSRGVTRVGSALQTLVGASKKTHQTLQALGVDIFNSSGHFIGLQSVIQQLQPKLAALTQQQQLYVAQTLFGKSAGQALLNIIMAGVPAWQHAADEVTKHNAVTQAAAVQEHSLHGEIETMKATLNDLAVKLGNLLIPKLTELISTVSSVVQWFEKHKEAAIALAAVVAGVLGAAVTMFVTQKVVAFLSGIDSMVTATAKGAMSIASKFGLVGTSSQTMAAEVDTAETEVKTTTAETAAATDAALGSTGVGAILIGLGIAATELGSNWGSVMGAMKSAVNAMVEAAETALNGLIAALNAAISLFNSTIGQLTGDIGQINSVGVSGAFGGNPAMNAVYGAMAGARNVSSTWKGKQLADYVGGFSMATTGPTWMKIASALAGQGFSRTAIAGILGNFAQENGGNSLQGISTSVGPQGQIGFAQWTGKRATAERQYAASHHLSATDLVAQVGYLLQELRTTQHGAFTAIQGATSPGQAARLFEQIFEGAGSGAEMGHRIANANQAYQLLGGVLTSAHKIHIPGIGAGNAAIQGLINTSENGKKTKAAATSAIPVAVATMLSTALSLAAANTPYTWGGGHNGWDPVAELKKIGVDCSGFVSQVLHMGGVSLPGPQTTGGLAQHLQQGRGQFFTVWDKTSGAADQQHVILQILNKWFESGGIGKGVHEMSAKQAAQEMTSLGGFHPYHANVGGPLATMKQLKALGISNTTLSQLASATSSFNSAIQSIVATLVKAANALLQKYQNLEQSGTVRNLSSAMGLNTGGEIAVTHRVFVPGRHHHKGRYVNRTTNEPISAALMHEIEGLPANASVQQIDKAGLGLVGKATAGSHAEKAFQSLVLNLLAAGQKQLAQQLVAAHNADMATLVQELYANQTLKDAESLQLQATQEKDRTTLAADTAADQLAIVKDSNQRMVDALTAAATAIKDSTAVMSDSFSAMAQSIGDSTALMADASNTVVASISDNTQVQVDILGERGLYGLNLVAQKEQVQLDQAKAYYDQQIDVAQQNLDAVKATWDAAISAAQVRSDQVQLQQDSLVALAQQAADTAQLAADTKLLGAQQHVDSVTLGQDIAVQIAQAAVDLSATAPRAQQDIANAALRKAESRANLLEAGANSTLVQAQIAANKLVTTAQDALSTAQGNAAIAEANAQKALADAQGQAAVATATAQQQLQGIQNAAAQTEAQLQGNVSITQAEAQTQYAGSGLVVNMYGINPSDAAANASELGWVLRTQVPA